MVASSSDFRWYRGPCLVPKLGGGATSPLSPETNPMKHMLVLLVVLLAFAPAAHADGIDKASCTFNGKNLWGKVQVVKSFPDIKVQVVNAHADLKVQKVTAFPTSCGKWQFVDAFPDLKVQYVDAFADVKVKYVDAFPGTG